MKKLFLIPAVALILLCLALAAIAFYGYHAQPKLVKEVIWSPELIGIIGAILCMFFIDNRLVGKLFSFVFLLDKLEYGWYITCGVYVKNKVGRTFTPGKPEKANNLIINFL